MRIDHTRIAIRERSWLDNLDLALQVIRANFRSCVGAALIGAIPCVAINYFVLDAVYDGGLAEIEDFESFYLSMLLVMIEAPLATAPLTLLLGQAMFVQRVDRKKIARDFAGCLPQLLLFQLLLRTILLLPVLTWIFPYGVWPYLNEIILLERNPLIGRNGQLSTRKRSSILHRGGAGDNLVRAAVAGILALLLVGAIWISLLLSLDVLLGVTLNWTGHALLIQGVLWLVAMYFTVARFLSYLDQRIRNEGWEVELALRGERERLMRHAA